MFGADTDLVMGALQMAGITAVVSAGSVYLLMRRRKPKTPVETPTLSAEKSDLEERVRVLERIATDRSTHLAEEIQALREPVLEHTEEKGNA